METDLTIQLTIEEKANLENLEGAIKRELGSFIVVGHALAKIRDQRLYREGYKNFKDYCDVKWNMTRQYAHNLITGSQVAENLSTRVDLCSPCEIMPINEAQVRPLVVLAPNQQRDVWEEAVKTAPAGKVWGIFRRNRRNSVGAAPAWVAGGVVAGAVAAGGWFRRTPGRVARFPMTLLLGCPLCGPWRGCGGPESS